MGLLSSISHLENEIHMNRSLASSKKLMVMCKKTFLYFRSPSKPAPAQCDFLFDVKV